MLVLYAAKCAIRVSHSVGHQLHLLTWWTITGKLTTLSICHPFAHPTPRALLCDPLGICPTCFKTYSLGLVELLPFISMFWKKSRCKKQKEVNFANSERESLTNKIFFLKSMKMDRIPLFYLTLQYDRFNLRTSTCKFTNSYCIFSMPCGEVWTYCAVKKERPQECLNRRNLQKSKKIKS